MYLSHRDTEDTEIQNRRTQGSQMPRLCVLRVSAAKPVNSFAA